MEYNVQTGPEPGDLLVTLDGDLDLYAAPDFCRKIIEQIALPVKRIIFKVDALRYLDSSGVGVFLRLLREASEKNIIMGFSGLTGGPRKVMFMCNVISLFHDFTDEKTAWEKMRKKIC